MAIDTFIVYVGVYPSAVEAEADYADIKKLFERGDMVDAYDAAVVERRPDGRVRIGKQHETPTRVGGVLGGGVGLATARIAARRNDLARRSSADRTVPLEDLLGDYSTAPTELMSPLPWSRGRIMEECAASRETP